MPFNDLHNNVKIPVAGYKETPITLGDKIRNKRIELQLTIRQLAALLNVTDEAVIYWEHNKGKPKIYNYPKLIEVLGFFPVDVDTSTLSGRIQAYRYAHGLSRKRFSKILGVDDTTLRDWESNKHTPMPKKMKKLNMILGK